MRVVAWIDDELTPVEPGDSLGWLGGWFNFNPSVVDQAPYAGKRWVDYLASLDPRMHPYVEAVRVDVVAKNLRLTGDAHQHGPHGMPLFEDGKCLALSFRAWGDLMAAIWSEQENKDYTYMDFYM